MAKKIKRRKKSRRVELPGDGESLGEVIEDMFDIAGGKAVVWETPEGRYIDVADLYDHLEAAFKVKEKEGYSIVLDEVGGQPWAMGRDSAGQVRMVTGVEQTTGLYHSALGHDNSCSLVKGQGKCNCGVVDG